MIRTGANKMQTDGRPSNGNQGRPSSSSIIKTIVNKPGTQMASMPGRPSKSDVIKSVARSGY